LRTVKGTRCAGTTGIRSRSGRTWPTGTRRTIIIGNRLDEDLYRLARLQIVVVVVGALGNDVAFAPLFIASRLAEALAPGPVAERFLAVIEAAATSRAITRTTRRPAGTITEGSGRTVTRGTVPKRTGRAII